MDSVDIPSERVPEGLKACEQILKRGKEVKKVEPVVTYWCCFAAAQKALDVRNRSKEDTAFLMLLLDALEQMKAVLGDNDAVTNEAAGAAHVENFALKVFMSADNEDRNGSTGKGTIRKFVVAGQFIEVLRCFENGMTEEMEQKLQYARWKAADGAKALREGRAPTSGPPIPDIEISLPDLPSGSPSSGSQPLSGSSQNTPLSRPVNVSNNNITPLVSPRPSPAQNRPNLPGLDTSGNQTPGQASGAWSTVATPGLAEDDDEHTHFNLPSVPSENHESPKTPDSGDKKTVRFTGPDGAPLSPAQTHFTVDSYDAPDGPPPTEFDDTPPRSSKRDDNSGSAVSRPRGDSNSSRPSDTPRDPTSRPSPTIVPPPPPPSLASYPSVPPTTAHPNGLGLTSPPPSAPPLSSLASKTSVPSAPVPKLTRKQMEQTQKHARWAISALEFEDTETARTELRKALAMLGG